MPKQSLQNNRVPAKIGDEKNSLYPMHNEKWFFKNTKIFPTVCFAF